MKKASSETFKFVRDRACKHKFGAHIGATGGVSNAVLNAMDVGANSFALFLKSPRRWVSPDIKDSEAEKFIELCKEHGYNTRTDILPHGQYFINLASPEPEKEKKSYDSFLDDLKRCEKLNIGLYNFHPGSVMDGDHSEALERLASNINKAIKETSFVKIVIENMAGHGNLIGGKLEELKTVIDMIEDKSRVGVCIDTCHSFAAGYDMSTEEAQKDFWKNFEEIIGWDYLSAIHLNDSKAPLGANKDLHQNIGLGVLGLECFRVLANSPKLEGLPIILETPCKDDDAIYGEEIKLLELLRGIIPDGQQFLETSKVLAKKGEKERLEHLKKFEKKQSQSTANSNGKNKRRQQTLDSSFTSKKKKNA